jgi:hypothetical protein
MTTSADVTAFRLRTAMPGGDVDLLEAREAGYLDATIAGVRAVVYAQLRKRYDVTFPNGVPDVVWRWITMIVTPDAYLKRGANPADDTIKLHEERAALAYTQITAAADSVTGLYDLPLLSAAASSAISRGGPISYAEASPYTSKRRQADAGRGEDRNGR